MGTPRVCHDGGCARLARPPTAICSQDPGRTTKEHHELQRAASPAAAVRTALLRRRPATGTSKKATWSLVSGIVSLLCCGPLGILAIVLGRQAQAEIATTGQQGAGLAKAGFILGIVALVFFVIQIIVFASGGVDFDFSTS